MSKTVSELRAEGHAVVIFNPTELRGANSEQVEDRLIELGWEIIEVYATEPAECRHDWVTNEETDRTYCLNCGEDGDG